MGQVKVVKFAVLLSCLIPYCKGIDNNYLSIPLQYCFNFNCICINYNTINLLFATLIRIQIRNEIVIIYLFFFGFLYFIHVFVYLQNKVNKYCNKYTFIPHILLGLLFLTILLFL